MMRCDMVVALGQATVQGESLLGINLQGPTPKTATLVHLPACHPSIPEIPRLPDVRIPHHRQKHAIVGWSTPDNWGLRFGVNDAGVAGGFCSWQSRLEPLSSGISAGELVRVVLEHSRSARQAHDLLTELLQRHGQRGGHLDNDAIYLLTDGHAAFVLEAAGHYWASLECPHVRAVTDAALISQDWQRISPGLAAFAIAQGWWPDDGSKLDFVRALASPASQAAGLKRWSKATQLLEDQHGHIDPYVLRGLLREHFEETDDPARRGSPDPVDPHSARRGSPDPADPHTAILVLSEHAPPLFWLTLGPASLPLYVPLFVHGSAAVARLSEVAAALAEAPFFDESSEMLSKLQARIDRDVDNLLHQPASSVDRERFETLTQTYLDLVDAELLRLPRVSH